MVISAQVLSINIGGSSDNSSGNSISKGTKFGISSKSSSPETAQITAGDEIENQEDQQQNQECSINSLVAKTPSSVWFKHSQPQQHPKWLLNCCASNFPTTVQQLTVLTDSINSRIPDIATPATSIAIIATATDSNNTAIATTTAVSTTTVPETTTEQDMSRESRHVYVIGLPDSLSDERISSFFSTFGRVQKVERLGSSGFVVSFMDVRSAQKAHSAEPKFQGHKLRITFHEQSKNGLVSSTASSNATGIGSPQNVRNASSCSMTNDSHRRSSDLHSPNSSSSKQIQKERMPQHRLSSSSSRRQSRERDRDRERGNSSRTDERPQRNRTSGNVDRRIGAGDSRASRRSRHSPRASTSSDSSSNSTSPSVSSGHHHQTSSTHTVQSTVVKLSASGSRRSDTSVSNELSAACGNYASLSNVSQGIQGIYVSNLPSSRTESFLKDGLINCFKKFGKIIHVVFEMESSPNFAEQRRALIIFQRLMDVDKLKDVHHLFGLRLKIRFASHSVVTEVYNTYLATNGQSQECISSQDAASTSTFLMVDAFASRASRTLYVGGLERRTTDDSLRARFSCFGHILETEVKNWESPSPFAFIQFADIHSVVCALNAHAQSAHAPGGKGKFKMNWGRTIVSNKIWIGELPSSCSADYLREKIRVSFTDTFNEVIYDPRHREALLLFSNNDSAQKAFAMIKTKQVAFWNADEKKDVHVPVDYCSEKLHDYFVDRKFRGESGNAFVNETGSGSLVSNSISACSSGGGPAIATTSSSSLLTPPPDPPSHLRETSLRVGSRRLSSNTLPRRRSDEREGCRNSSRSLRYTSYNRSRRRRERARRDDVSPSTSSTSSSSSDSDLSSSSTPERKRTSVGHSKSNIQRLHKDKILPSSRQPCSPSSSKGEQNLEQSDSTTGTTLQDIASHSSSRACMAQLLPPPMPSALILNPAMETAPNERRLQQEYHQPAEANTIGGEPAVKPVDFKHQQSLPSSNLSGDDGLSHEANGKSITEQRSRKMEEQQQTDAKRLGNHESHESGFYNPTAQENFSASEINVITSNRIEEIANTLVNVLQHHSKASTSTTASAPLAVISGTHQSHSSTCSAQRSSGDACDNSRLHFGKSSVSSSKRTKWPWGNDPIKNHCAIPLDGSTNRGKDPRHRKYSPQISTLLPFPKFVHEHHSTLSSHRSSAPNQFRSPQQQRSDAKCSRNSLTKSASGRTGSNLKWSGTEKSPLQKVTRGRTHSSLSRSESSCSEAMLSPDPSNSSTQPSLVTSTMDIFGDTSPANNSTAYRERLDALGATFQNIEQKFQKTKQNTHLDYDRKGSLQRSYKFEEELERLKARTGSSSSIVSTSQSLTKTCSTVCSHSISNTFADSSTRTRICGIGTTSICDSKDTENQKLVRTPLSVSIPMQSGPITSTVLSPFAPVLHTACTSTSNLPSPQFSVAQLKKPPLPPSITHNSNQTLLSAASSRIAYPPDFSIPPPPLPQPPVPPTLSSTIYKSAPAGISLISAPPPPPLICNSNSNLLDSTSSCPTTSFQPLGHNAVSQSGAQSSSWRNAAKPSTPPPASLSAINAKQTSVSFASNTSKPSTSGSVFGSATSEMEKMRSRTQGTEKVQIKEKEHMKMHSKSHLPEKKMSKDFVTKQPSLSELFRQQAQDSSEVLKKQFKKVGKEKGDEALHKSNDENRKGITESTKEKHAKDNERKIQDKPDQDAAEKEKDKHPDGKSQLQEVKLKNLSQKLVKERKEKKEPREKEHEAVEFVAEKRKAQRLLEKSIKNKSVKDVDVKQKEKVKEKDQSQKNRSKKRQEEERRKQKEKEKEQRRKELTKKRKKRKRESSTSSSEETSSSEVELHSFDRELKRLFMEEEASGSLGLSMYDRVKQRSSSKPDDAARKNRALELLQERTQSRRNNEQSRPKRVQLESTSSDEKKDSSNDEGESDSSSCLSVDVPRGRNKKKKAEPKGKSVKKSKSLQKKLCADEETKYSDGDDDDDGDGDDDDEGVGKDAERSDLEEQAKRKHNRKATTSKSYKKQKKTTSLSLDDVFGTYSTDDESTKHSRGSIVPSLYREKDGKEEIGKKVATKVDENQKSKIEKEKMENTRRLNLKKEHKKENLEESDESQSGAEGKKITSRKTESKQIFEKSIEKKLTGRKRLSKSNQVDEADAVDTVDIPEKKKQKAEKSLIEISMFREEHKKPLKVKTPNASEQKKRNRKPGINRQFEKKLAKKLKREQKERYDEQKREAAKVKQDEKLQRGNQLQKNDAANSDGAEASDVLNLNDGNSETATQTYGSSSIRGVRKRHLKAQNSEEIKRSRKETTSPKTDLSEMDSDSCVDMKRKEMVVKQEPSNKFAEETDGNDMKNNASGSESKLSDHTNTDVHLFQLVKTAVAFAPTEVDNITEGCATNTGVQTMSDEYLLSQNMSFNESDQSKKNDSVEQKVEIDGSVAAETADNIISSKHPPEDADFDHNRPKQQRQEFCMSEDDEGGNRENIDRITGRKNSVSSTNSNESHQTSLLSTSSGNLETQLEDGPEDQKRLQILPSEKIKTSGSAEILESGGSYTEQEFVEKTESEEKLSLSDMVMQLSTSEGIIFVPNSDSECSTDPTIRCVNVVSNARAKQQQQSQNAEGSRASVLDTVNDVESNGSFELIDEGRVGDVDSLTDQYLDNNIGGIKQQLCVQSTYEVEHVQREMMEAEEEQADGSKCIATVEIQDDVHDVQETEFAVQSIVLDDNRSQHSGEDSSTAVDYLSESAGGANSRRDSLTDTAVVTSVNKQQGEDNSQVAGNDDSAFKSAASAENQEVQRGEADDNKGRMDVGDKRCDSHLDEVIDDVVAGGYMEVDAEQLMRINSKRAKEEAVLRAAAASASAQGSSTPKVVPSVNFSRGPETSQYGYQNATQGSSHIQQQYGGSGYHIQQSQQHQQSQIQQIPLQQSLLSQSSQQQHQQQQLQKNIVHGNIHVVLQQQQPQQQQHMVQAVMQQQQPGDCLNPYQQSQSQIMKVPENTYHQPQHLPPIEQRVLGTAIPQQQQPHPLQSKSTPTSSLYFPSRNAVQQVSTAASFASPQISLQQQQQHHLFLQQQQNTDNMHNVSSTVSIGAVHTVPQLTDVRQQVVQAVPSQQQKTQMVVQPHQQQQSINYGSPMITSTCSAGAIAAAQTVAAASRQLDLNKQLSLSTAPIQESITNSPYDLYTNLQKKAATGTVQSQHQQQTQTSQHQQQVKVSAELRQNRPNPSSITAPPMGHAGAAPPTVTAANLQTSRSTVSANTAVQANRAMQQQQLSPTAQQAVAFAIGLPGSTSPFTQMQQQYLQQMYRSTLFNTFQAAAATNAYSGGNVAAATGTYGPGGYSGASNNPAASVAVAAAGVLPGTVRQDTQRQQQQQPHLTDLHQQQQYLTTNLYQQSSPRTTLCSPQQANIAAQQLNSLYGAATGAFPISCEPSLMSAQQMTSQQGVYNVGVGQRQQDSKQPLKLKLQQQSQQQVKTYAGLPAASVISRYPIMWQGIIALKTNETRVQMHKVGGNAEMCKRSLDQFTTTSNHMPLIRINQRMRMEAGQLESVQCKMMDEHSYIALVCLSCGPSKEDIKSQSELLKERFVDYLESKQAAGICNVGNELNPTPNTIVHIFPPCDFASAFLRKNSPDLLEIFRQQKASYLFVVITSAN